MRFFPHRFFFLFMFSLLVFGLYSILHSPPAVAKRRQSASPKGAGKKLPWNYLPGRVIVKFKPGIKNIAAGPQMNAIRSAYNIMSAKPLFQNAKNKLLAEKQSIGLSRIFLLEVEASADIERMVMALRQNPAVEYAEPDYIVPIEAKPRAPLRPAGSNGAE